MNRIISHGLAGIIALSQAGLVAQEATPEQPEEVYVEEEPVVEKKLEEPAISQLSLTKKYRYYWLSDREYNFVQDQIDCGLVEKSTVDSYLGFVVLMRYKPLIDFVTDYYDVDQKQFLNVINQESAFSIGIRGISGERGIGQVMPKTASTLLGRLTDPEDSLYYPFLDKESFSFRKLSGDYRLNIILIAAMLSSSHSSLDDILEEEGMAREDFAAKIIDLGKVNDFKYLKKRSMSKFRHYHVNFKLRERINEFWASNSPTVDDINYLVYNGGENSVKNLLREGRVSEILQVNFYTYMMKKQNTEYFIEIYSDIDLAESSED